MRVVASVGLVVHRGVDAVIGVDVDVGVDNDINFGFVSIDGEGFELVV